MNNWQENPPRETTSKDETKEFLQFVGKILANWFWVLLSTVICLSGAFFYSRYYTPVYKISAKVLFNDEKNGSGLGAQNDLLDLSSLLGSKSSVDNEAEVLKTRMLMEKVVRGLNLNITYYSKGNIRDIELIEPPFTVQLLNTRDTIQSASFDVKFLDSNTFEITNEDVTKTVKYNQPLFLDNIGKVNFVRNVGILRKKDFYKFEVTSIDQTVSAFMNELSVSVTNKQVSTIDLIFNYPIPQKGELILNSLIEKYVQGNITDKNLIADSTISFIENRLQYVGQELGDIEGSIQNFKQKSKITDITEQSKVLIQSSGQYIDELAKVETQLSILNSLENYLKDGSKNKRVLPSAVLPEDMVFSGLIERYNTLLLDRDRQSLSSTENNPYIQNLEEQISNLRIDMLSNLSNTRSSLIITRNKLRQRTGLVEGEIRKVPAAERTYLDLARQQQIKQELYIFLLQKREETAISKTSNISNSKVIDLPKANPIPFKPNKRMILLVGLAIGLIIPLSLIYFKGLLNTRVVTKQDITDNTIVSIIAEIGNNDSGADIIINNESRTPIAEQFRSLRTNLSFFLKGDEKTILLTSSMSGEGKSFISLNLANVLAISGKKVVVMEMDLRKPNLSSKLNLSNSFGVTNYIISEETDINDIIVESGVLPNLYIISSGPIPPNPAETILTKRLDDLMEALKAQFDYIIIDAPPVGLVTDAQLLSKYSDLTLYVVRQGYTYKSQLAIIQDLYSNKKMKQISVLINDIKLDGGYGYGYGYGGYGYGYGDYGHSNNKKRSLLDRLSKGFK
ncbi:Tyrosine-protein kinase Wzc [Arcticibacter svalbardensis MN12-7]|uniref:non-specific protein-tyrosine kinase n=1 Tax=Arcticibacter svalbardensis MN12-7 TaxID=1150600 RepID=R9GQT8_9SPHI|nr:tyrosine-protein kinase [Arcticibacter svalbardensis]EOR94073.1 Tyrosine-protein kinase Wzc [Arcticibacter svalbardensis MN12-7]